MRSPRICEDITHFVFCKIFLERKDTITYVICTFTFDTFYFTFDSIIYVVITHITAYSALFLSQKYPSRNSSGISVQLVVKLVIVVSAIVFCV